MQISQETGTTIVNRFICRSAYLLMYRYNASDATLASVLNQRITKITPKNRLTKPEIAFTAMNSFKNHLSIQA